MSPADRSLGRSQLRRGSRQRGTTLIELSVSIAVLGILLGGVMGFLVLQGKMGSGSLDRSDIHRGGRAALSLMEEKIGMAGLGLPRHLAIKSLTNETCGTIQMPKLEVAALDYVRQWTVAGTVTGAATLAAITNGPPPNPSPGGIAGDLEWKIGQWVYLYRGTAPGAFGMAKLTAGRAATTTAVPLGDTNYSLAQASLSLDSASALNDASSGRPLLLLLADVAGFGVNCTDEPGHPYLYWEQRAGQRIPVSSNVATPEVGGVIGLVFRFYLDTDGDGVADGSPVTSLTFDADPDTATHDDVVAVEVDLQLRSERPDPASGSYRVERFVRRIQLLNLRTTSRQYVFVDNAGI